MSLDDINEKAEKYVMYVRKSTDEHGKQDASIESQITYCKQLVAREDLNCVKIIKEKKSAKKSGQRPLFNKLLEEIKAGKYDGIIAWHPDRLARNMGDGGRIIEMVDEGDIADLRFCTQRFSKDANGKMLLGLAFVLSKQYSDKLCEDVRRTNLEKHKKGNAIGRKKHGYKISDGKYVKGEFWNLIKKAWEMRLAGLSEAAVSDWLNEQGYFKKIAKTNIKQYMTPQKLNTIFKDRFYFGYFTLKNRNPIYLQDKYGFPSMITEDEFYQIQRMGRGQYKKVKIDKPLKGKVVDSEVPGIVYKPNIISNNKGNRYLRYVVDNSHKKQVKDLEVRKKLKAVRASEIVGALGNMFESMKPNLTKNKYSKYVATIKDYLKEQLDSVNRDIQRLRTARTRARNELADLEESFIVNSKNYDKSETKAYKTKKKELATEIKRYTEEIKVLELDEDKIIPSFEEFLNTLKKLISNYKNMPAAVKLEIAEEIVLNLYVHNGKVLRIELKEPLDNLISGDLLNGRPIRI